MEPEENYIPQEQEDDAVEIYSRRAIFWFSLLASPLFGGVLLMLNLRAAGYKRAVNMVGIFTILFVLANKFIAEYLISYFKIDFDAYQAKLMAYKQGMDLYDPKIMNFDLIMISLHIIGALILSQYFFKKYFPEEDYYPKPVGSAIFFTLLAIIILPFLGVSLI